jgi:archaellum component FlaF (FlaF/FlaG flagellin family)
MEMLTLTTNKPVKGVAVTFDGNLLPDDNCYDLFPGDPYTVSVPGLHSVNQVLSVRYYR